MSDPYANLIVVRKDKQMFKVTASKLNQIKVFEFATEDEMNSALNAFPEAGWTALVVTNSL